MELRFNREVEERNVSLGYDISLIKCRMAKTRYNI